MRVVDRWGEWGEEVQDNGVITRLLVESSREWLDSRRQTADEVAQEVAQRGKQQKRQEARERAIAAIAAARGNTPWGAILHDLAVALGLIEEQ